MLETIHLHMKLAVWRLEYPPAKVSLMVNIFLGILGTQLSFLSRVIYN